MKRTQARSAGRGLDLKRYYTSWVKAPPYQPRAVTDLGHLVRCRNASTDNEVKDYKYHG